MLVSEREDHKQNFVRTSALADALSGALDSSQALASHGPALLRFYAAESGLKYLLNRYERVPFTYEVDELGLSPDATNGFPGKVEKYSHDLERMLRRLKVAASAVAPPSGPFRTVHGYKNGQDFEIKDSHTVWRYGLATTAADQIALEGFLISVINYIRGEI